jgi:hypothetical protein
MLTIAGGILLAVFVLLVIFGLIDLFARFVRLLFKIPAGVFSAPPPVDKDPLWPPPEL